MASKSGIIQLAADVVQHAASSVTWCYSGGCKFLKLNDVLLFQNCIKVSELVADLTVEEKTKKVEELPLLVTK